MFDVKLNNFLMLIKGKPIMAKNTAVAPVANDVALPSFLMDMVNDEQNYHQDLTAQDALMPRIKLLQPLSSEVEEGATAGMFYSTVDGTEFDAADVYSLSFIHKFTAATPRNSKEGVFMTFDTKAEAEAKAAEHQGAEVSDTHQQILSIPELGIDAAMMYFQGSALAASKSMNTQYMTNPKLRALPRHVAKWRMTVERKKNDKGFWFAPKFTLIGFAATQAEFIALTNLADAIKPAA
jgi:hypothetical protein